MTETWSPETWRLVVALGALNLLWTLYFFFHLAAVRRLARAAREAEEAEGTARLDAGLARDEAGRLALSLQASRCRAGLAERRAGRAEGLARALQADLAARDRRARAAAWVAAREADFDELFAILHETQSDGEVS